MPGYDVATLTGQSYAPYVWVGTGTNQPTTMPVGGGFSSFPNSPQELTFDGAYTKTVRHAQIFGSGPGVCATENTSGAYICNLIKFGTAGDTAPLAVGGDSGGPVFCYACYPNVVTPAGLIEGGNGLYTFASYIGADQAVTGTGLQTGG